MRRYVLAGLAMLLVACGGDKATGPTSVTGNYTLRTVDTKTLPANIFQDADDKVEVSSGNINLAADNSWTGNIALRITHLATGQVDPFLAPVGGTYSLSAGAITLTDATNGFSASGTVGGGTLSFGLEIVIGSTNTLVFQK
jgi:hypothetical protein